MSAYPRLIVPLALALPCAAFAQEKAAPPAAETSSTGRISSQAAPAQRPRAKKGLSSDAMINPATGAPLGSTGGSMNGEPSGPVGFDSTIDGRRAAQAAAQERENAARPDGKK